MSLKVLTPDFAPDLTKFTELFSQIEKELHNLGYSYSKPKKLAQAIQAVSDQYTSGSKQKSLWKLTEFAAAYIGYFLPLNTLRTLHVINLIGKDKLSYNNVMDYGCGPGTSQVAFNLANLQSDFHGYDLYPESYKFCSTFAPRQKNLNIAEYNKELTIFNYSINELPNIDILEKFSNDILIIEPGTKASFSLINNIRNSQLNKGKVSSPCTHSLKCPLEGTRHWCHFKFNPEPYLPTSFLNIYKHLPFNSKEINYSYLFLQNNIDISKNLTRVIGDTRAENGKKKTLICSSSDLEYFSVLKKDKDNYKSVHLQRGNLISLNEIEKKGNELRLK